MTYDEVLSHFDVKVRKADSAKCICPVHKDKEPSLSISRKNGKILMNCLAKCNTEDILEKVGLEMSDLDQRPNSEKWKVYVEGREKRRIEGIYHYCDCNGRYVFTRLRLSGKKFIYGKMEDDRFQYGLGGKSRRELSCAVFCKSVKRLKDAIKEGKRISYCEGEKDVLRTESEGMTSFTCGSSGDWDPRCAEMLRDADVVIFQDNDESGRKLTQDIIRDLKAVTKSLKVIVPTPDLEHGDISDYLKEHTVSDLEELILAAEEVDAPEGENQEETEEPEEDGQLNLDRFHHINKSGQPTGVFDYAILKYLKAEKDFFILGGVPFIYDDGVYHADRSGTKLKTMIRELIYPELIKSTTIKRIFELFVSDEELQVTPGQLNDFPKEWINFKNGFYDPLQKKMIPHDPKYRAVNQIPHEYDPESPIRGELVQSWLRFICNDPEDVEMLLQYSGLCLTRDTRQQKFLILNGEGGTGKSTVIRMIDRMIGEENISNISLNQLTQRFFSYGLMGKLLNSCADLELDALSDVSTLKKVLGEDTLSGEAKGKDAVSFKSYAKLIFSTNELPIVKAERTNGFYRRLLILTMDRVPEKKETDFFDRLAAEIGDFIRLSVEALERMYQTKQIMESRNSIEAVKRMRCDSDTVEAFLNEKIVRIPDGKIKKLDLYRDYENYCENMERQSLTKQNFYRSMKTKGFGEIKTSGTEYFKGIFYSENLPKNLPKSPDTWTQLPDDEPLPFD